MKCLMLEIVVAESAVAGMILCQNTHKSSQKDLINVFGKTLSIQCYSWRLGFLKGSLHLENSGKAIRPERHWTLALSNTRTHTHAHTHMHRWAKSKNYCFTRKCRGYNLCLWTCPKKCITGNWSRKTKHDLAIHQCAQEFTAKRVVL